MSMSFRDSYGVRRIPGKIVREQKETIFGDMIVLWGLTFFAGILAGAVISLICWVGRS